MVALKQNAINGANVIGPLLAWMADTHKARGHADNAETIRAGLALAGHCPGCGSDDADNGKRRCRRCGWLLSSNLNVAHAGRHRSRRGGRG